MSEPSGTDVSVSETVCGSTAAEPLLTVTSVALPLPVLGTVALPVFGGVTALPVFGGVTVPAALPLVVVALPVFGGGLFVSGGLVALPVSRLTTFSLPVSGSG